jgi:hypothetical protein
VDHALPMGFIKHVGDLDAVGQDLVELKWPPPRSIRQCLILQVLCNEKVDTVLSTHVVNNANVRVCQRRNCPGLALEPRPTFRIVSNMRSQGLDSHCAAQSAVVGFIDLAHPADANEGQNLIRAEPRSGWECHRSQTDHTPLVRATATSLHSVGVSESARLGLRVFRREVYPSGVSPKFEEWLAFVGAHLPFPVSQEQAPDGSTFLTGGDPGEVIVRLTRSSVTVWEYAAEWEGPHTPVVKPIRVGSVMWRRLPETKAMAAVHSLIEAARESRLSKFAVCRYCDRRNPPESMHDEGVCQSCAEKHLGVVY